MHGTKSLKFKWTCQFRRKTKSGFCACAITFQLASMPAKIFEILWYRRIKIVHRQSPFNAARSNFVSFQFRWPRIRPTLPRFGL